MTKPRCVHEHFRKIVQRLKKTLRLSASDKSPLSLDDLPEECISIIVSFTSPRDACVFALVSRTFESAVQSDTVWEKFIPPEYESLISQSRVFSSNKELYFALCDESVLIDDGKKSLWIEKSSAKRCIMLSAMNLAIVWGNSPQSWRWIPDPGASNMVPVPFIVLYLKRFAFFLAGKEPIASKLLGILFKRTKEKAGPVEEFQWLGLMLFVAVPFLGTGAWTGAIIAVILDMPFWSAVSSNFCGVVFVGLLVNLLVNLGLRQAIVAGIALFFVSTFMWSVLRNIRKSIKPSLP